MKKLLLVLLMVLAITSFAFASYCPTCPPGPKGDKGDKGDQGEQGIQGVQGEKGDTGERRAAYGPGIDVVVYEAPTFSVETQYRYDINRDAHSIFAVTKVKLWEIIKGKEQ